MKVILLSLLLFGLAWAYDRYNCDCGWRNTGRIGGGQETKRNEYPWQAAIGYKSNKLIFCAGALITQWHVLTSARCVYQKKPYQIFLYVGNFFTDDDYNTQKRYVEKIIIQPHYDRTTLTNNIAIVVAKSEFEYTSDLSVGPVCLNSGKSENMVGKIVKTTGWGSWTMSATHYDQRKLKALKEADFDVITSGNNPSKSEIYVQGEGKTFGRGDGGNPMVWLDGRRFTLVGLFIANGKTLSEPIQRFGIGVYVPAYLEWIKEQVSSTKSEAITCHKID